VKAILSDIHGNLAALKAVLEDIEKRQIEEVVCLGDMVGYGPDPGDCLRMSRKFDVCVLGNHEEAVLFRAGKRDFRVRAEMAIEWTKRELFDRNPAQGQENLKYLHSLQEAVEEGDVLYVHGSPLQPLRDYVYPKDIQDRERMGRIFEQIGKFCFCGHTHLPGVFRQDCAFVHPHDLVGGVYLTGSEKVMVNVGSVGQPRDGDPRACYVTFDGDAVVYRRVEYNVDETVRRVYAAEGLDSSLGDRLRAGK